MNIKLLALSVLLIACSLTSAAPQTQPAATQPAATQPTASSCASCQSRICRTTAATQPATTQPAATQPAATTQPTVDPVVDEWLTKIEEQTGQIKTLHANLSYKNIQTMQGNREVRLGTLVYKADPPQRFVVHFNQLIVNRRGEDLDESWIFDGHWLAQRDQLARQFTSWELVGPEDEGKNIMEMSQGSFVLPLDMNRLRVLSRFDVTLIEDETDDGQPANTIHLRLTPRAHINIKHTQIDLWYDRETLLPKRSRAIDHAENESTFVLSNVVIDEPIEGALFDTTVPQGRQWIIEQTPLNDPPQ
jgi:outer membrane lipoprotein-sorting protein